MKSRQDKPTKSIIIMTAKKRKYDIFSSFLLFNYVVKI